MFVNEGLIGLGILAFAAGRCRVRRLVIGYLAEPSVALLTTFLIIAESITYILTMRGCGPVHVASAS
jgi:hypothetical protein